MNYMQKEKQRVIERGKMVTKSILKCAYLLDDLISVFDSIGQKVVPKNQPL